MTTPLFIDSCAWNFLFDNHVVMEEVFPPQEFRLFITREVEIELLEIPDFGSDGSDKRPLKRFIQETVARYGVRTGGFWGFRTPSKHQVNMGFGQGGFRPQADRDWYATPEVRAQLIGKPTRNSSLSHNQADASLAVRSFSAIVLTNEKKTKPGPIKLAKEQSGHILYLRELPASGLTLKEFVQAERQRFESARSTP